MATTGPLGETRRPLATELLIVVAALLAVQLWTGTLWKRVVGPSVRNLPLADALGVDGFGAFLASSFVYSGPLVASLVVIAAVYVRARNLPVGTALPGRSDLALVALAVVTPAVLIGVTDLVGNVTGVPFKTLVLTAYAERAPFTFVAGTTLARVFVAVPLALVLNQVLVQGSVRSITSSDTAIVLTTLLGAFVLGDQGLVGGIGETPKYVGVGLFALASLAVHVSRTRFDARWIRAVAAVPAVLFVVLSGTQWVASIDSIAAGLYGFANLATLGVAAYTYERTDSLLVPALAYASLFVTSEAIVFLFEPGPL
ncbi:MULTISPECIES: hypothetical protein [Halomicrobium]|uniref:CPBP family intramembrane metalloprotease n=2 Tax=Halomicrobium mukohataei TaxID=57705 RepID=C7P2C8_HALMD|nr:MULTISPECIES: hypothetical protein [Halomicrobium]ACV49243.1 hypothetical protein Hmuk_3138 [Halomicrobium mukohataei DSM 12286]QCD64645.1 hypothetical protein E5139_02925 [Halomicrobium mukohataei]QFR19452.1 hypothetical protein GBQ70_02925 [Halomicrobium sp. ZPS1]